MKIEDSSFFEESTFDELAVNGKEIRSSTFEFCKFLSCDFSGSTLVQCKFVDCEFKDTNLNVVKLDGTRISGIARLPASTGRRRAGPALHCARPFHSMHVMSVSPCFIP